MLDLLWAGKSHNHAAPSALRSLLADPGILKLGFGFQQDLNQLHATSLKYSWGAPEICNMIDLRVDERGLATLLQGVLNFRLDKSLQCSPWGRRPLT